MQRFPVPEPGTYEYYLHAPMYQSGHGVFSQTHRGRVGQPIDANFSGHLQHGGSGWYQPIDANFSGHLQHGGSGWYQAIPGQGYACYYPPPLYPVTVWHQPILHSSNVQQSLGATGNVLYPGPQDCPLHRRKKKIRKHLPQDNSISSLDCEQEPQLISDVMFSSGSIEIDLETDNNKVRPDRFSNNIICNEKESSVPSLVSDDLLSSNYEDPHVSAMISSMDYFYEVSTYGVQPIKERSAQSTRLPVKRDPTKFTSKTKYEPFYVQARRFKKIFKPGRSK